MNLFSKILTPIILVTIFTQCDKADLFHDAQGGKYIYILNQNSDTICSNYYNKNGLLIKSISHDDSYSPGENAEFNYTYNINNLISKKTGYIPGNMYMSSMRGAVAKEVSLKYEYDNSKRLSKITTNFHYPGYTDIDYSTSQTFEYMNDKTIEYKSEVPGNVNAKIEYLYNAQNNIHTKLNYYSSEADSFILYNKEEFTYDSYKTPFQVEPTPQSKNNVLSNKITNYQYDEQGVSYISYISEYVNTYEYNSHGYPEKHSITYPNGFTEVKNYKY